MKFQKSFRDKEDRRGFYSNFYECMLGILLGFLGMFWVFFSDTSVKLLESCAFREKVRKVTVAIILAWAF